MRFTRLHETWSRMGNGELVMETTRIIRNTRGCRDRDLFDIRNEIWFFLSQSGRSWIYETALANVKEEERQVREQEQRTIDAMPRKGAV